MKKSILVVFLIIVGMLTGCASKLMEPATPEKMRASLNSDESAIVFLRATNLAGAIQAPVVEVVNGELQLVGIVSAAMKVRQKTTPGKHIYVVGGESSEVLEADLEGGKTYYSYISPRIGWWKARFVFRPVAEEDRASTTFKNDLAWCKWHQNAPEAEQWLAANMSSMREKYVNALKAHEKIPEEKRKIIRPEFGVSTPVE